MEASIRVINHDTAIFVGADGDPVFVDFNGLSDIGDDGFTATFLANFDDNSLLAVSNG